MTPNESMQDSGKKSLANYLLNPVEVSKLGSIRIDNFVRNTNRWLVHGAGQGS